MGAVNQHVTYNELLPRIIGPSMVNAYGLALQNDGYYAGYDARLVFLLCPTFYYVIKIKIVSQVFCHDLQ